MSIRTWVSQVARSIFFDNSDTPFVSTNVQDAIQEARNTAEGFPRAGIALIQNGTSGDGDLISYSNLVPNTDIVFPVQTKLNELTFANNRNSVECDLELYLNGTAPGDLITTLSVSTGAGVRNQVFDLNSLNLTFAAGDFLKIIYRDIGTSARDMVIVLWISRIPEP